MVPILQHLVRLVAWPNLRPTLKNIPCAPKDGCSAHRVVRDTAVCREELVEGTVSVFLPRWSLAWLFNSLVKAEVILLLNSLFLPSVLSAAASRTLQFCCQVKSL